MKEIKKKTLYDLELMDRFLFDNVMEDKQICQDILSICLGVDIPKIREIQAEKELELSPELRAVRLDIFSFDMEDTAYNAEMQKTNLGNLPKRSRLYQAHLDVSLMEPGDINFNQLNDSYIIMIMGFDLFQEGKYRYTFRYFSEEKKDLCLKDGAVKVFLNTKGTNETEVDKELVQFLKLVENWQLPLEDTPENARLKRIQDKIRQVKENERMGVRYLNSSEEKIYERLEGREEGRIEGRQEMREEMQEEMYLEREKTISHIILDGIEDKVPKEKIVKRLVERYQLSMEETLAYIQKYENEYDI